ncbi:glycosyltransferase family 2 protein [Candidatus Lariskella endosymbiont of Hedychridium roseum]|uniref:glycosyltransferase family 2 protein n=1 Tax=Candidatus Lariskella endosymbiont of Hedychridium roseum TaxID=3077949 RepID=UPI0030D1CD2C
MGCLKNVTEDAELGIRIKSSGFKVGIIDSYTLEEAPIHVRVWIKQRMRWMKGHLKTYLDLISAISKRYQNTKKPQNVTTSTL